MNSSEHLEISRKLALAIGWKPERVHTHLHGTDYAISIVKPDEETALRLFDYRDMAGVDYLHRAGIEVERI